MGHIDPGGQSSSTEVEQNYDEEEGVCKAPEQFESKAAQSCPLAEPPRKRKREECQATSLVISKKLSNKSGVRKIEIKRGGPGHSDDPSNSPPPRLEIVSGCFDDTWLQDLIAKKPATVECKAVILAGPCERGESGPGSGQSDGQSVRGHKDSTYDVPFAVDSRSDTELKFKASAQGRPMLEHSTYTAPPARARLFRSRIARLPDSGPTPCTKHDLSSLLQLS